MSRALQDVLAERERQGGLQHGGVATNEFDKGNSQNDWIAYVTGYTGRAADKVSRNVREAQPFRANMIKAASLALAAIEAYDQGLCPDSPGFER